LKKEHVIDGCKRASWFLSTSIGFIVLIIVAIEEGWDYPDEYLPPSIITWIAVFAIARLSIWVVKGFLGISDEVVREKVDSTLQQESIQNSEIISSPEVLSGEMTPEASKNIESSTAKTEAHVVQNKKRKEKSGVGGWLLFFCIQLVILGPLFSSGKLYNEWELSQPVFENYPALRNVVLFENIGSALLLAYGFFAGLSIWKGESNGRKVARIYLLFRLFGMVLIEFIALVMMGDLPSVVLESVFAALAGVAFREGVYFLVWWLYFKFSKRVRNTYG